MALTWVWPGPQKQELNRAEKAESQAWPPLPSLWRETRELGWVECSTGPISTAYPFPLVGSCGLACLPRLPLEKAGST